jgi:hypothetical protein
MARIRSIKPDAFTSDTLSSVSVLARWTFAGLWTYCDDEGRGRADARLVKAALFPIDDHTGLSEVREALDELEGIGAICRYTVAGTTYLHIPTWLDHQKVSHPTASKIPVCPGCSGAPASSSGEIPEDSVSPPESLAPERKGIEGNREQGSEPATGRGSPPDRFDDFWAVYPRKDDKARARKAWVKATKGNTPEFLIGAAQRYGRLKSNTEKNFILLPTTWLNGERWEDEVPTPLAVVTDPSQLPPVQTSWMERR